MASETLSLDITLQQGDFSLQATLDIGPGITVLTGPSGAGKSTLAGVIAGATRPDSGNISLGKTIFFNASTWLPPQRRKLGYVLQDSLLFPHLSIRSNLLYGHDKAAPFSLDDVASTLDITDLLDRSPHQLSGGERRRVALGRAILTNPSLLILDEPLANLDAPRRAAILPMVEQLRDRFDLPILYVTHSWDEIIRLADTLVLMENGRITAQGPLADVLTGQAGPAAMGIDGAVIEAQVSEHLPEAGLTKLETASGPLFISQISEAPKNQVRLFINAGDVALALARPDDISVQNILSATVEAIDPQTPPVVHVLLRLADGQALRARITPRAVAVLNLQPGLHVHALVKSVALDRDLVHHPV